MSSNKYSNPVTKPITNDTFLSKIIQSVQNKYIQGNP